MYDNINFKLRKTDVSNIDFLNETPKYFDVSGEHYFNGERVLSGTLNGDFKITVNINGVNIKGGSLCKWYLNDNFQTLGKDDAKKAVEKLSDTLHLQIDKATVTRLDMAQNFIVRNPVEVYYNHLGELKYGKRSAISNNGIEEGLYYFQNNGMLVFYNKVLEQSSKRQPIPELYQNRHVLRYEQRYTRRLPQAFNTERVTGSMLYDEAFYIGVINRWKENYFNIKKINDVSLNFEAMKGKKDLYTMGLLSLVETQGGELNFISQINEAFKKGQLSRRQADELKYATREACKAKTGLT